MSTESSQIQRSIFFSIRKNTSFFAWRPYGEFFSFSTVCIEVLGEGEFAVYEGNCLKVQELGKKRLASAARFRRLRNGIYIFEGEKGGKYIFRLIRPLQRKA
jgi:hypothetical protein